jgi:glycosyltransferase involved in cell wall biosynthesis
MRVFVVEPDGAGGMIHYAHQLCSALAEAGADVTLVTSRHYELATVPASFEIEPRMRLWPAIEARKHHRNPAGAAFSALYRHVRRAVRAVRLALAWESLTRYLIRTKPDVVQFSIIRFPFQALWLQRMRRAGLTLTQICHEFEPRESRFRLMGALNTRLGRSAYRSFSAIFFHSSADRDRFSGLHGPPPAISDIIPHGNETLFVRDLDSGVPDLRGRYRIDDDRPVALFFGGLRPSKGVGDLLEAFAGARDEIEASLLIVGHPTAGFPLDGLRRRVAELGLAGDVVIDPNYLPLDEVGALMRTARVIVLPYRSATASGSLQVAFAFGKPVVVTNVGGLPEAVDHGSTGLVIPHGDRDALTRALVKLLSDPGQSEAMGEAAREAAEVRFSWLPIADKLLSTYRRLR